MQHICIVENIIKIKMLKDSELFEQDYHMDLQEFLYDGDDFIDFED